MTAPSRTRNTCTLAPGSPWCKPITSKASPPSMRAAVRHVHERQAARIEGGEAFDVIGLHQGEPGANVQVFRVRDGAVIDRQAFYVENAAGRDPAEVMEEFLLEFYWDGSTIPPEIVAPLDQSDEVAALLAARRGARVIVLS